MGGQTGGGKPCPSADRADSASSARHPPPAMGTHQHVRYRVCPCPLCPFRRDGSWLEIATPLIAGFAIAATALSGRDIPSKLGRLIRQGLQSQGCTSSMKVGFNLR